jgi:hypothetical protein
MKNHKVIFYSSNSSLSDLPDALVQGFLQAGVPLAIESPVSCESQYSDLSAEAAATQHLQLLAALLIQHSAQSVLVTGASSEALQMAVIARLQGLAVHYLVTGFNRLDSDPGQLIRHERMMKLASKWVVTDANIFQLMSAPANPPRLVLAQNQAQYRQLALLLAEGSEPSDMNDLNLELLGWLQA